jgi:hypothetical protein
MNELGYWVVSICLMLLYIFFYSLAAMAAEEERKANSEYEAWANEQQRKGRK